MDLFLSGVPEHMTQDSLEKELRPHLNALSILDWGCQKPRTKRYAFLHFLKASDGENFLLKHGSETKTSPKYEQLMQSLGVNKPLFPNRKTPGLRILSSGVRVERSRQKVREDFHNHLIRKKEKRERQNRKQGARSPPLSSQFRTICCGKIIFSSNDQLAFASETSWNHTGKAIFRQRELDIVFEDQPGVQLRFPYNILEEIMVNQENNTLTLILNQPPRLYKPPGLSGGTHQGWERRPFIAEWPQHEHCVGHCLVYELSMTESVTPLAKEIERRELTLVEYFGIITRNTSILREPSYLRSIESLRSAFDNFPDKSRLPYVVRFQLEALVWNNYLHPATVLLLFRRMESYAEDRARTERDMFLTSDSIKRSFQTIAYPYAGMSPEEVDPVKLLARFIAEEKQSIKGDPSRSKVHGAHIPPNQALVLRANVTPTRITLGGPDPETSNKVLRKFEKHSDYFMRVSFTEEDGQDMPYHPKISHEPVYRRYRAIFSQGIEVAGRVFEFLGFSHSSLRSHSTWFVAPFLGDDGELHSRDTILKSLGDFSDIRVPAKCAARIGQAFSETPFAVNIMQHEIRVLYIDDVKTEDGQYFSDGVGTISLEAARVIWSQHPALEAATCFQIRWAGCKGMLSLDTRLRGKLINIRKETMMKFPGGDLEELGICDAATRPLRMVLNRQLIKILEDMGTDPAWFVRLQNRAVQVLREVTEKPKNTSKFLEVQSVGKGMGLPYLIRVMNNMGIDYRQDALLRSIVEHVVLSELRLLKHKSRIPVPKGVTLFGVMDETGFLEENEVFVQFENTVQRTWLDSLKPSHGDNIMVTRCPALHPGDFQLVKVAYPPHDHPLASLRNCIAFSSKGSRGLPSKLSGGDLDGDLYNIIWDAEAMPARTYNAAAYSQVTLPELDREVVPDDIADFFINFMKTDILGLIAVRHLAIADTEESGTCHSDCLTLADMHSTAVDYSKTGIPVDQGKLPRAPRTRPDFMSPVPNVKLCDPNQIAHIAEDHEGDDDDEDDDLGRSEHWYHKSKKIIGELYRSIDERKVWKEDIQRRVNFNGPSIWEQLFGRVVAELEELGADTTYSHLMEEEAKRIQRHFGDAMQNLQWQFSENPRSVLSEVETFCGSILGRSGLPTKRQRDKSIKLKEEVERVMGDTVRLIREPELLHQSDGLGQGPGAASRGPLAAQLSLACLVAGSAGIDEGRGSGRRKGARRETEEEEPLLSFRVVAGCCLVKELRLLKRDQLRSMGGGFVGVSGPMSRLAI